MIELSELDSVFPFLKDMNPEEVLHLIQQTRLLELKPGTVFLEQGSLKSYLYFVKKGLIRSFYVNEKGEEITNRLRYENQVMTAFEMTIGNQASRFNLQALEATELLVIDVQLMRQILEANPRLEAGRRYFINHALAEALAALDDFILLSPEERYLKFVKEHPDILNRVPNKYIANVLGITPVSLSRIRKRISTKKQ